MTNLHYFLEYSICLSLIKFSPLTHHINALKFTLENNKKTNMSTADGATSNNTSKNEEYIKLRVVGQDNS
jgi:hypothetical protein